LGFIFYKKIVESDHVRTWK